jgi:DNA-binding winged helix-turn-helix (wHTH) protein
MSPISNRRDRAHSNGGVVVEFSAHGPRRRGYNDQTMQPAPQPIDRPGGPIRIGDWILHPDRNLLESAGAERRLEPKAVDALPVLVEGDGAVVSKEELIDRVWENRIISEGTLTNTIAELRRALGDDARNPVYIETIPKRGYRLVCAVERATDFRTGVAVTSPGVGLRRTIIAASAIVGIAAAAAVLMWFRNAPLADDHVLTAPFANRTGDPRLDPFSTLARDRIVAELAGSAIAFPVPIERPIAGALADVCREAASRGAGLAMTGALYLHEGEVEIQTQLVNVAECELLYAAPTVVGSANEVASSIEGAIQRALGALAIHLTAHAHATLLSRPPVFEAYREFIAGSELFASDLPVAIGHLERAVELDPGFTSAQFRLAMSYKLAGRGPEGRTILDRLHAHRGELTEFERLWLDSFIANFEGRWSDALSALRELAGRSHSDWTVLYLIGSMELALNRPRHAVAPLEMLHARELPGFVTRHPLYADSFELLARARHQLGDHTAELAAANAGRERFPADRGLMAAEARARAAMGDEDGIDRLAAEAEIAPGINQAAIVLAPAAATARAHGHPTLAARLAARAVDSIGEISDGDGRLALLLGRAAVEIGRLDQSQLAFARAVRELDDVPGPAPVEARGWLGMVAARRGDIETAEATERELAEMNDPYLYGLPTYYRAAITGWLGRRASAVELLKQARASGWSRYFRLHDDERVLFEPLEGEAAYRAMLVPAD